MQSIAEITDRIARLFEEELGAKDVGPDTHFIFSGGDSLNAESLVVAINEAFGLSLKTATLLDAPTHQTEGNCLIGSRCRKGLSCGLGSAVLGDVRALRRSGRGRLRS
jgi:acyl carrier protein